MAKKKLNLYATINRGANMNDGTRIRLNWDNHTRTLRFLQEKHMEMIDLKESNPDQTPSFYLKDEDWNVIAEEIGEKDNKFTKASFGTEDICIICHEEYKAQVMDIELLRHEADRQKEVKEKFEKEEQKEKKTKKKK